jgi:NADH-quinone oxidoreductase subunit L
MTLPLIILAVLSIVSGLIALPAIGTVIGLPGGFGEFLYLEDREPFHFEAPLAVLTTAVTIAGIAVSWALYGARIWSSEVLRERFSGVWELLTNKFYMDDLYQAIIDRVVLAFGGFVALFDRRVVNDVGVNGSGSIPVVAGAVLRLHQTGKLYNYGLAMVLGVLAIVLWSLVLFV